jgi:enoyl-CoA hydratase
MISWMEKRPSSEDHVVFRVGDQVAYATLDRTERRNAVTSETLDLVADFVVAASSSPDIRVVVLRGSGSTFCSGADLADGLGADGGSSTIDAANRLVTAMTSSPKPVVAVVEGVAAGVGVSIALAADITLAASDAYFLLAFTKVGLMPDGGASSLIAASVGRATTLRLALLAEPLGAAQAAAAGLIAAAVDDIDSEAERVVGVLRSGPARAFAKTKEAVNSATLGGLEQSLAAERTAQLALLSSADFASGSSAFRARRAPVFTDV